MSEGNLIDNLSKLIYNKKKITRDAKEYHCIFQMTPLYNIFITNL